MVIIPALGALGLGLYTAREVARKVEGLSSGTARILSETPPTNRVKRLNRPGRYA